MKRTLQFMLTYVTFFLILGIITAHYFSFQPTIILILIIVGFVTLFIFYNQTKGSLKFNLHFGFSLMILSFIIGISTVLLNNKLLDKHHYTQIINTEILSEQDKTPKLYNIEVRIDEVLKSDAFHHKYEVLIHKINGKPYKGKVLLNISIDSLTIPLEVDQNIQFYGVFRDIEAPKNPYYFDYKKYLKHQQIHHQLFISTKEIQLLTSKNYSLKGFAFQLRKQINEKLKPFSVPKDEMAVINALLLGQRQEISKELMENYTKAGAIHILAISGLHIGIILMILHFLFSPLNRYKKGKIIKSVILILLLWMYALIAGFSASVVRAVMMFSVVAVGMNLNKKPAVINTLIVSLFILLLINPLYIFNVGFQLSYLAVFSIVVIQPMMSKIWNPKNILIKFFWNLLTVSIAAQIGVLPLSLYYFHQFPGLFIISNLVIIPFLGIILVVGILIFMLVLLNSLPHFLINSYVYLIKSMNEVIKWVSLQESFLIKEIHFTFDMMLMLYLLFIFAILFLSYQKLKYLKLFLVSIIGFQLVLLFHKSRSENSQETLIFHKNKQSIIADKSGEKLIFFTLLDTISIRNEKLVTAYSIGNAIAKIQFQKSQNIFYRNEECILVIDSVGIFEVKGFKPTIVILRDSPKINLNRIIDNLKPKLIIADGSNYTSYVNLWDETCLKRKTPFHHTGQKGAYIIK